MQGKRQGEHPGRAELLRRPAGHPGPARPATEDQRQPGGELRHHRRPGLVQVGGGRGGPAAGDPVGLGDQRHAGTRGHGGVVHRRQVGRVDVTAGAVTEDELRERRAGRVRDPDPRRPARCVDREAVHSSYV
jgi:hypothetical protein